MYTAYFAKRWSTSVAFKLSMATAAIVVLVALLQASVGLQTFRLAAAQNSIVQQSVPMLAKTQEFARITTRMLGQTALLEERLSVEELTSLRSLYVQNEAGSETILAELETATEYAELIQSIRLSRKDFAVVNEQLFENQFLQRAQEESILAARADLYQLAAKFEDVLDAMLIQSTVFILKGPSFQSLDAGSTQYIEQFMKFAAEIETLNSLKGSITDIQNILQNLPSDRGTFHAAAYIDRFRLDIRSVTQSLTLLQDIDDRQALANLSGDINSGLMSENGFVALLKDYETTQENFDLIRKQQTTVVEEINREVEDIIADVTAKFDVDIALASSITNSFLWIGLATTALVFVGISLVNHFVIQKQISRRFVMLTEDVAEVSGGNFAHDIRISGRDELGDIAKALDQFRRQAAELERSNSELERFAYVAAHDLRSPLDAIQDLARWTLEDERDCLSESCIKNLELLIQRSARLSALQADLLTYARAGEIDASVGVFHPKEEIAKMADLLDPQNNFKIRLENDPGEIQIYTLPIRQILINLITNAIKHHDKGGGAIIVRYEYTGAKHRFIVEDDGPGIEPRFQSKIFELFKTLQSRDNIEGSGLGLALVKKLIDRLGGIVVELNAPDARGTKFIVEINDVSVTPELQNAA